MLLSPLLYYKSTVLNEQSFNELRRSVEPWGDVPFEWDGNQWEFAIRDKNDLVYAIGRDGEDFIIQYTPFVNPIACGITIPFQAADPGLAEVHARKRDEKNSAMPIKKAMNAARSSNDDLEKRDEETDLHYCSTKKDLARLLAHPPTIAPILFGPLCLLRRPQHDREWTAYVGQVEIGPVSSATSNVDEAKVDSLLSALGQRHLDALRSRQR